MKCNQSFSRSPLSWALSEQELFQFILFLCRGWINELLAVIILDLFLGDNLFQDSDPFSLLLSLLQYHPMGVIFVQKVEVLFLHVSYRWQLGYPAFNSVEVDRMFTKFHFLLVFEIAPVWRWLYSCHDVHCIRLFKREWFLANVRKDSRLAASMSRLFQIRFEILSDWFFDHLSF